ncbi:hypothetical protein [Marinibacterium sp. SX1]|uniref:hypothetical protein n=1 Tax=Marinibacterium sp. SX1 TaxID=3388424 RepID=UPI003D170F23
MRRIILATFLGLASASTALAVEWPWTKPSIYSLTRGLNCQSWDLRSTSDRAPIYGALPNWMVFNEGPSAVAIRGPGSRSRDIPPFDGPLVTAFGKSEVDYSIKLDGEDSRDVISARSVLGSSYTVGLATAGSARVHLCRL